MFVYRGLARFAHETPAARCALPSLCSVQCLLRRGSRNQSPLSFPPVAWLVSRREWNERGETVGEGEPFKHRSVVRSTDMGPRVHTLGAFWLFPTHTTPDTPSCFAIVKSHRGFVSPAGRWGSLVSFGLRVAVTAVRICAGPFYLTSQRRAERGVGSECQMQQRRFGQTRRVKRISASSTLRRNAIASSSTPARRVQSIRAHEGSLSALRQLPTNGSGVTLRS